MANAKDIIITKHVKGRDGKITKFATKLRYESKGDLCKCISSIQQENQQLKIALNNAYFVYANHLASLDILSKEEGKELYA